MAVKIGLPTADKVFLSMRVHTLPYLHSVLPDMYSAVPFWRSASPDTPV